MTASRLLVTGSRTWSDRRIIRDALAAVWDPERVLVSGHCKQGADVLCESCWSHWGGQIERHPADWPAHGRRAGPIRNAVMVDLGADLCLAFILDGSSGSTHCASLARQAGIPTKIYTATTGDRS
jgi:Ni,Fe-hydrogenase III small subunit